MKKYRVLIAAVMLCMIAAIFIIRQNDFKYEYGVFLSAAPEDMGQMSDYHIVVIDAQNFSAKQVESLKADGHVVYSYINVGAIEDFRPYYNEYVKYALGDYENWPQEKWVNVSQKEWQDFLVDDLAAKLVEKGVDGLFVDNCDVYYHYQNKGTFDGLTTILKGFKSQGAYVVINGGDEYVRTYAKRNGTLDAVMDAVNQETVFSKIEWDTDSFSENPKSERDYFKSYVELCDKKGCDVFLLEYTTDSSVKRKIRKYCKSKGYNYYISDSLELGV